MKMFEAHENDTAGRLVGVVFGFAVLSSLALLVYELYEYFAG